MRRTSPAFRKSLFRVCGIVTILLVVLSSWAVGKSRDAGAASKPLLLLSLASFCESFMAQIIDSADEIADKHPDPEIRKRTILWKLHTLLAIQRAVLEKDTVVAFPDVWLLCEQMTRFFESGNGKDFFGKGQPIAIRTSKNVLKEFRDIARSLLPEKEFNEIQGDIRKWAQTHPFRGIRFFRGHNYEFMVWSAELSKKKGLFSTMKKVDDQMDKLSYQITFLDEFLPLQIMWQIELLILRYAESEPLNASLKSFQDLSTAIIKLSDVTVYGKELVDHVFYRMMQLAAVVLVGLLIVLIIWKRMDNRSDRISRRPAAD